MNPYYEDDAVTIYHGDSREVLESVTFARGEMSIITDPPYGTNLYPSDGDAFTAEMLARFVDAGPVAVFGWPEHLVGYCVAAGVVPNEWVTWWPTNGSMRGFNLGGLWRESECVAAFGPGRWETLRTERSLGSRRIIEYTDDYVRNQPQRLRNRPPDVQESRRLGDVWTEASPGLGFRSKDRLHPNEKPVSILTRLVSAFDGVILDPFMGAGSTLRAAKDLGRKAVGVEIEERYCEIAAKRMAQEVLAF